MPLAVSSVWVSPAWPDPKKTAYANVTLEVDPGHYDAQGLISLLLSVEQQFGRFRRSQWGSRTLDIDIIDFRSQVHVNTGENKLFLPHLRAHERSFVMCPLAEIVPDWYHPVLNIRADVLADASLKVWPARPASDSD